MKKLAAIFFLAILLLGCSSVPSGPPFSKVSTEPGTAVVYIYRLHTAPFKRKPDIRVNDKVIGELPVDSYTVVKAKPGTYQFKSDWGFFDNPILSKSTELTVVEGGTYFVHFAGRTGIIGTTVTYGMRARSGELNSIPEELAACSFVAPAVSFVEQ